MLVLKRRNQQSIVLVLPDKRTVLVKVNKITPQEISLVIDAPGDVGVWRKELSAVPDFHVIGKYQGAKP